MHPILAHRAKLALYLAAWLALALLLAALTTLAGNLSWREALAFVVPLMLLYAFVCLSTWYLCRAFAVERSSLVQLFSVHVLAALSSAGLWLLLGKVWAETLARFPWFNGLNTRFPQNVALLAGAAVLLFWLMSVMHYLFIAFENTRNIEKSLLQLQLLAREAELQNLKAQIHPHFLFNSLHSLSALTTIDANGAREMCLRLSEFLRKSLAMKADTRIPLAEELKLLDNYLAIERIRFGTRLQVEKHVDTETESCPVPALLLQPLLENAVNHGIAHLLEGGVIVLGAQKRAERLEIVLTNPCDPDRPQRRGEGMGLQNVSKRLATLYGGNAAIAWENLAEYFHVRIVLPCGTA
ncbi:histidine kinase [candidate division KSB1 bacterium]|nr:histidine kinase [candidate division KSB1 bacterium]